jgi:hypothetical protein
MSPGPRSILQVMKAVTGIELVVDGGITLKYV